MRTPPPGLAVHVNAALEQVGDRIDRLEELAAGQRDLGRQDQQGGSATADRR